MIPPSPRPLIFWLGVAGVCAVVLTVEAIALLALTRRPARAWKLGLGIFLASLLGVALTARLYSAYRDLAHIADCTNCYDLFPWITNAVLVGEILGGALLAITIVCVVWTPLEIARASATTATGVTPGAQRYTERIAGVTMGALITDLGTVGATQGIAMWIQTAYLANPGAAGDGLGLLPLEGAIMLTLVGLGVLAGGLAHLWTVVSRPAEAAATPA